MIRNFSFFRKAMPVLLVTVAALFLLSCSEDEGTDDLLILAALQSSPMYAGFADIPGTVMLTAANTSGTAASASFNALQVNGNTLPLSGITNVYNPVRDVIKFNRDLVHGIGGLIQSLKTIDSGVTSYQGEITWAGQPAKVQYQTDTTHGTGGRKLEVWWNGAASPYNSLKAIELVFKDLNSGNESTQDINGEVWARVLNTKGALAIIAVDFDYTASSGLKSMSVAIQNGAWGESGVEDNAHYYVRVENDIVAVDGTITVKNFTETINPSSASRAYVFAAAGNTTVGVVKAAFPLIASTNTNPYGNDVLESFREIYTDWIIDNDSIRTQLNNTGLTACNATNLPNPSSPNPTSSIDPTSASLLACMDAVRAIPAYASAFNEVYFIPYIQNPAYYSVGSFFGPVLETVGTSPGADYDTVAAQMKATVRQGGDANYSADFLPNIVQSIDIIAGTNLPAAMRWTAGNGTAP